MTIPARDRPEPDPATSCGASASSSSLPSDQAASPASARGLDPLSAGGECASSAVSLVTPAMVRAAREMFFHEYNNELTSDNNLDHFFIRVFGEMDRASRPLPYQSPRSF